MTAINSNRAIRGPVTAVPVVAGKGVRFVKDVENNRVVAEVDETVLWTGSEAMSGNPTLLLSESCKNFEFIAIYGHAYSTWGEIEFVRINPTANSNSSETSMCISNLGSSGGAVRFNQCQLNWSGLTSIAVTSANQFSITSTGVSVGTAASTFTKIVGIHRIAGGN